MNKSNTFLCKTLLAAWIIICALFINFAALADDADVVVSLQIDNPLMKINGTSTEIDEGRGTKPTIADGRTLVPIRAVIEAFGGEVKWDSDAKAVIMTMNGDTIKLVIDSTAAYLNNNMRTLDVAPAIINERTMLPLRFVAEGFNLGVAWDSTNRTVTVIKNGFDSLEYQSLMNAVPDYCGNAYAEINNNVPMFRDYEIISGSFEYYSKLDELERCDVCMASIANDIMPTDPRESISSVTPTGWHSESYDVIEGDYLYNRCHLIGFQLTGENANKKNLITGTRYLNVDGMLPFENKVAEYIEKTGNHVMYRVTPVFTGDNLVADGVMLEAYSVEDKGAGISFCVYCYNVQPNIEIDYATGKSKLSGAVLTDNTDSTTDISKIYRTPSGKKYHYDPDCGGKNSYETTLNAAIADGLTPCQKCAD